MNVELGSASAEQKAILETAARTAEDAGLRAWLVGGPIRDAILGRPIRDLDFALERDAERFAEILAERVGGRVSLFPPFLTAKVSLPDGSEIDVATTRSERYPRPGALPEVEPGSLEQDLARRDFGINAMAMEVATGELADPLGGLEDLRERRIRVLHERSFEDDPTRAFRALRLAARLGFEIDAPTRALLDQALLGRSLQTASRERSWREVDLATLENAPARALRALADSGALLSLVPLREQPERNAALDRAESIALADRRLDRFLLFLAALVPAGAGSLERIGDGAGLSRRRLRALDSLIRSDEIIAALGATADAPGAIAILNGAPEELLSIAGADPAAQPAVELYRRYRDLRLPFRADQLGVEGGPHLAAALRDTRRALAAGSLSPEEALSFARSKALEYLRSGRER